MKVLLEKKLFNVPFFSAQQSLEKLRALNDYVKVHVSTDAPLTRKSDHWKQFTVTETINCILTVMNIDIS